MKIVLAVDGSKDSEVAARMLGSAFRLQDTEVLVLQVVEPILFSAPPQMARGYAPEMGARLEDQMKRAKDFAASTADSLCKSGYKAESRVIEREIRTGILDLAEAWHADLIVLGSHGEKGLRKFLLGSTAEFVARHAHCSVLIVRNPTEI
jgi:nucleotide-binding universal stress UspA family protein